MIAMGIKAGMPDEPGWFLIARNEPRANISQAYQPLSLKEHQKHLQRKYRWAPLSRDWRATAFQVAQEAGISESIILCGTSRKAARARWVAWQRILAENPQISILGLARICGFDHTTILHGLARISGDTALRPKRATGRRRTKGSCVEAADNKP